MGIFGWHILIFNVCNYRLSFTKPSRAPSPVKAPSPLPGPDTACPFPRPHLPPARDSPTPHSRSRLPSPHNYASLLFFQNPPPSQYDLPPSIIICAHCNCHASLLHCLFIENVFELLSKQVQVVTLQLGIANL